MDGTGRAVSFVGTGAFAHAERPSASCCTALDRCITELRVWPLFQPRQHRPHGCFHPTFNIVGTGTSSDPELAAAGVLDNALLTLQFSKGAMCTIAMSRGATYGYDNRIEVFGDKGKIVCETPSEVSVELSDVRGVHRRPLQYSFPQRFHVAFVSASFAVCESHVQAWVLLSYSIRYF
jgi:hypothetical protein